MNGVRKSRGKIVVQFDGFYTHEIILNYVTSQQNIVLLDIGVYWEGIQATWAPNMRAYKDHSYSIFHIN